MKTLSIGTTFSGIGAPEQALQNIGIEHSVEWSCDIDKRSRDTYAKNFNCKETYEDIRNIDLNKLSHVDLYVFGFPCQSFSVAGKGLGMKDDRGLLIYNSVDILKKIRPKFFIAENVKGLINHDGGNTFKVILSLLENCGYKVSYKVLNSIEFGIPCNRQRIYLVGVRNDLSFEYLFPEGPAIPIHFKNFLDSDIEEKYFLDQQRAQKILEICKDSILGFEYKKDFGEIKGANKMSFFGGKIRYSGIMWCQNCVDIHGVLLPDGRMRKLTPRECANLQGFPKSFVLNDKDYIHYKQFGNTMTVNVIEAIIKNLIKIK